MAPLQQGPSRVGAGEATEVDQEVDTDFLKLNVRGFVQQQFGEAFLVRLSGNAQHTSDLLPVSELFSLGGAWSDLSVVTKGGLVGEDDTLAALVDHLWKED